MELRKWSAVAMMLLVGSCGDVGPPPDTILEIRAVGTTSGQSISADFFALAEGQLAVLNIFAFREPGDSSLQKEPVPNISGRQILPGILVEVSLNWIFVESCSGFFQDNLSADAYVELQQVGVGSDCLPLTPAEQLQSQAGTEQRRPICTVLFDDPEDNGKSVFVRTGANGQATLNLVYHNQGSTLVQDGIIRFLAIAGAGVASYAFGEGDFCTAATTTSTVPPAPLRRALFAPPARHDFGGPLPR